MELQAAAVRMGWLPFYPQFNRNPINLVSEAEQAGAKTDEEITRWVVDQLRTGRVRFAVEDADSPENWPQGVDHLARKCPARQCERPRVLPATLSRNAQQRDCR